MGCWLRILSGDGLHLWLLGTLVYLTLFGIDTVENSSGVNWILRDFKSNIQSFGSISIYVVYNISETGTRALKLATKLKTTYLLGFWLRILSRDGLHLWLFGAIFYLTFFDSIKSVKTPAAEYFSRLILTKQIWIHIKQMCFIIKFLKHYFYAIGKYLIFNQKWHYYALESKGKTKTTGRSC